MAGSFFGRRKAKTLSPRQQEICDRLLPELLIPGGDGPIEPSALFGFAPRTVRLEIGFGGGEHLAAEASGSPKTGFIGAEPFINGIAKLLAAIERGGLSNIRIFDGDATVLLARLTAGCIENVDLLYPDPWPKRRHWKRRLVNQRNLANVARVLAPGGRFRFASDIDHYVNWTLRHVMACRELHWTARCADDWRQAWDGWHPTRYEAKAVAQGRAPAYLVFEKRA